MVEISCVKRLKRITINNTIIILIILTCVLSSNAVNYRCRYPCACDKRPKDPVCAANSRTYPNQCYLDLYNENVGRKGVYVPIAYVGPCYKSGESNYPSEYNNGPDQQSYNNGDEEEVNDQYGGYPSPSLPNETNVPSYSGYQSPNVPLYPPPRRPIYSPYFQPSYGPPIKGPPPPYSSYYQPRPYSPINPDGGYQQQQQYPQQQQQEYPQYQDNNNYPPPYNNNSMTNETELYPSYPSNNYTTSNETYNSSNETLTYPEQSYPSVTNETYNNNTYNNNTYNNDSPSYENVYNPYNSSEVVYEVDYYTTTELPTTNETATETTLPPTTPGIPNVPRSVPLSPSMFVRFDPPAPPPPSDPGSPPPPKAVPVYAPVPY